MHHRTWPDAVVVIAVETLEKLLSPEAAPEPGRFSAGPGLVISTLR